MSRGPGGGGCHARVFAGHLYTGSSTELLDRASSVGTVMNPHANDAPRPPPSYTHTLGVQVSRESQPINDICEFLTSDSVEAFVLSYTTLLTIAPGITPALLANLINARAASDRNISKADVREVCARARAACSPAGLAPVPPSSGTPARPPSRLWTSAERCTPTDSSQAARQMAALRSPRLRQQPQQLQRPRGAAERQPPRTLRSRPQSTQPGRDQQLQRRAWRARLVHPRRAHHCRNYRAGRVGDGCECPRGMRLRPDYTAVLACWRAKKAGAISGNQDGSTTVMSRAYCRVVRTSSLNTTHSAFFPHNTEPGCSATVCPPAITRYVPARAQADRSEAPPPPGYITVRSTLAYRPAGAWPRGETVLPPAPSAAGWCPRRMT